MVSSNRARVTRVKQHSKAPQSNNTVFNLFYIVAICIIFVQIKYGFSGGHGQTPVTVSSSSSSTTLDKPPSIPIYNTPIVRSEDSPDDGETATQEPTEQDSEQDTDGDTEEEDDMDDAGESVDGTGDASLDLDPTTVTPPSDHDDAPDTDD